MKDTLEFRLSAPAEHHALIADFLNTAWQGCIKADKAMIKSRLESGNLFLFAYDVPSVVDIDYARDEYGLDISSHDMMPVGVLETIAIKTGGDYDKVPKTYHELTDAGCWRPPENGADTVIMVDITTLATRRGSAGKGEAREIIYSAKPILHSLPGREHFWTYTPAIEKVRDWHKSLGAVDTGHIIKDARPGFAYPDVNMLSYRR